MNRQMRLFVMGACLVLVMACAGGPQSPSGPLVQTSAPGSSGASIVPSSANPSRSPVVLVPGPPITVKLVGDKPVIAPADGPPGRVAVMPAAVTNDADGTMVAFLVWFGSARGDQQVTVARSTDGRAWTMALDPIYTDFGMNLAAPGPVPGAALRAPDGTWILYGWAATAAEPRSFVSWRATAAAPEGPWMMGTGEDRVLPAGPAGSWDDQTAAVTAVVHDGSGFAMWYDGQRAGRGVRGGVGYASSPDGVAWTRHDDPTTGSAADPAKPSDGDPVIGPGDCGPATDAAALGAQVWRRSDGFFMLFGGARPDGKLDVLGATSADGIHWSCSGEIVLHAEDIPGSNGIESIHGATLDGQPILFIESLVGQGTEIWLAKVSVGP